jgi:nucleotide-binding universal stress UspA family protein
MQISPQEAVVVGVDGSAAGLAAVRLAAREAVSRGRALTVVHAFTWPDPRLGSGGADYAAARRAASRVVDEAVSTAQRSTPGADVRGQLVDGPPGRVLLRLSRGAALVVLGGDGSAAGLPSPVLTEVVTRSWCPVEVARGPRPSSGPVLAAIDGSSCSLLALRFAAAESRRRGCPLWAVHVMTGAGPEAEAAARRMLDRTLLAVADLPQVRRRVLTGPPQQTLVVAARHAGMIVLGPRGGGPRGVERPGAVRLGSVAEAVLRRGGCPAVFVHGPRIPSRRLVALPGRSDVDQVLGSTTP